MALCKPCTNCLLEKILGKTIFNSLIKANSKQNYMKIRKKNLIRVFWINAEKQMTASCSVIASDFFLLLGTFK